MADTTKVKTDVICTYLSTLKYAKRQRDINTFDISEIPSRQAVTIYILYTRNLSGSVHAFQEC